VADIGNMISSLNNNSKKTPTQYSQQYWAAIAPFITFCQLTSRFYKFVIDINNLPYLNYSRYKTSIKQCEQIAIFVPHNCFLWNNRMDGWVRQQGKTMWRNGMWNNISVYSKVDDGAIKRSTATWRHTGGVIWMSAIGKEATDGEHIIGRIWQRQHRFYSSIEMETDQSQPTSTRHWTSQWIEISQ